MRIGAMVGVVALLTIPSCKRDSCERVWSSGPIKSPDQRWAAEVYDELCYALIGSSMATVVEVRWGSESKGTGVLAPFGEWEGGEHVRLRWQNASILEIAVPNRTSPYLYLPKYKSVTIVLRYEGDDPADREQWWRAVQDGRRRN
jgi:hypothetical protein